VGEGGKAEPSTTKAKDSSTSTSNLQTAPLPSDTQHTPHELDRRKIVIARSRRPSNTNWRPAEARNGSLDKRSARSADVSVISMSSKETHVTERMSENRRLGRLRSPWSTSLLTIITTGIALLALASIVHSFSSRQLDPKGCRMSYMRPSFAQLSDFDTEHTRFASKYSVYLYREGMVDEDTKVGSLTKKRATTNKGPCRSKEFLFYSYREMLGVISKSALSPQKQPHIFMMFCGMIPLQLVPELEI